MRFLYFYDDFVIVPFQILVMLHVFVLVLLHRDAYNSSLLSNSRCVYLAICIPSCLRYSPGSCVGVVFRRV